MEPASLAKTRGKGKARTEGQRCPIVGMGASAGGLEAFLDFFGAAPKDGGLAFVVIAHLDPTHVSLLPELIQRRTEMTVASVVDEMVVLPNHVYVIPPNRDLSVRRGVLHLRPFEDPRVSRYPIDGFFSSLAQDQGASATCVVLSGTGSDGALGLTAIKEAGGLTLVQRIDTAKHDGMLRSAVETGHVDMLLPPEEMPAAILSSIDGTHWAHTEPEPLKATPGLSPMESIHRTLLLKTGCDFAQYKIATVARRVRRRMQLHHIEDLGEYAAFLRTSTREPQLLFKDLLIGVTSFFRDPPAYAALQKMLTARVEAAAAASGRFRVWVAGCSTGEEAYSLAMVLHECIEAAGVRLDVQIFATDLDADAVATARKGRYPLDVGASIGEERLKKHFVKEERHYRLRSELRETVIFAVQNVVQDPPFTRLDLISCRNVLIYLTSPLQRGVLSKFHYCLNPEGMLVLGVSESVTAGEGSFHQLDARWKLFTKRPVDGGSALGMIFPRDHTRARPRTIVPVEPVPDVVEEEPMTIIEAILRQSDASPCAVVDPQRNVAFVHGKLGRYLEPASGTATMNILSMARHGLRRALASALDEAAQSGKEVRVHEVRVRQTDGFLRTQLSVRPLQEGGSLRGFLIVSFHDIPASTEQPDDEATGDGQLVDHLRTELEVAEGDLQTTKEEMENANEELRSLNEELQSANEELQSANEELETSKEELQSLHEEAETVNAELEGRVRDLAAANDDLKNLLDSTHIATIFLDIDLQVRRFTPSAAEVVPLVETDVGRPIADIAPHVRDLDLARMAGSVLNTLVPVEVPLVDIKGRRYHLRTTPYRTADNVIDGVVMTFQAHIE